MSAHRLAHRLAHMLLAAAADELPIVGMPRGRDGVVVVHEYPCNGCEDSSRRR
jgi:hypothetical protein